MQLTEAAASEDARHSKKRRKVMGGISDKTGATVKRIAQIVDKLSAGKIKIKMNIHRGPPVYMVFWWQ